MDDNDLDICGCANHVVVPTQRVNEGSLWHVKVLNISYWPFLVTYNQNLATETESMSGIKAISYMPEKRILYFHLGKWVGHLVKLFPIFNLKFHKSQVSWNWYWKYLSMFHFTYFRYFQDLIWREIFSLFSRSVQIWKVTKKPFHPCGTKGRWSSLHNWSRNKW